MECNDPKVSLRVHKEMKWNEMILTFLEILYGLLDTSFCQFDHCF